MVSLGGQWCDIDGVGCRSDGGHPPSPITLLLQRRRWRWCHADGGGDSFGAMLNLHCRL